tara:strand:- start:1734 stop:2312 length:579 start_codon:yes stop_codon:yes gene_type:complete
LAYRLAASVAIGLPLIILIWAAFRKEAAIVRLLSIYWKIASLMGISILLLTDQRPIGYLTFFLSPFLMVASVWFWVDLSEELTDLPPWRALPFTVRLWRWSLSGFGLIFGSISYAGLECIKGIKNTNCLPWTEKPLIIHHSTKGIFEFLFGGNWNEPVAAFIGYFALVIYTIGLLQWLLIQLPKSGRIAGGF